jgi:hypothetical protein
MGCMWIDPSSQLAFEVGSDIVPFDSAVSDFISKSSLPRKRIA